MGKAEVNISCPDVECLGFMHRHYAGERKQTALSACRREQDASLVLPTAKQFESPSDPDGSRGLGKWLNDFEPAPGNKRPQVPAMPAGTRKTFATASSGKTKAKKE